MVTTYGSATPRDIATYAITTSNAIGTGKNVPASATSKIPPIVAGACSPLCGIVSTASAPSTAANTISGKPTRATYQKLFAYDFAVVPRACDHVADADTSIAHSTAPFRAPTIGKHENHRQHRRQLQSHDRQRK